MRTTATANLALLGDKNLMFNADRTAFIMYQASGSSWVCMGDPVGPPGLCESLVWIFSSTATAWRSRRCSIRSRPTTCRCTSTSGLTLSKLGEEARVPLAAFSPGRRRPRGPAACAPPGVERRRRIRGGARARDARRHHGGVARRFGCLAGGEAHGGEALLAGLLRRALSVAHFDCARGPPRRDRGLRQFLARRRRSSCRWI